MSELLPLGLGIKAGVKATTGELHVYANFNFGLNTNDGLQKSAGTGGSFSYLGGVVTFTGTGAAYTVADVGRLITIAYATSSDNNGSFVIASYVGPTQVTYANAKGVIEAMPAGGKWSVSSPKKTLSAVFALIPDYVKHFTVVHLSGTGFTGSSDVEKYVAANIDFVVDGGMGKAVVADNAGSSWTPDIFSINSLGLTTAGWVADAYAGYWLEITAGTCAGQTRLIRSNTTTTLIPCRNFSTPTDASSVFRIVRPATSLASGTIFPRNNGNGYLFLQNLYVGGSSSIQLFKSVGNIYFSHIISNSSAANSLRVETSNIAYIVRYCLNSFTDDVDDGTLFSQAGWGSISLSPGPGVYFYDSQAVQVSCSCFIQLVVQRCLVAFWIGSRARRMELHDTLQDGGSMTLTFMFSSTGYANTKIDQLYSAHSAIGMRSIEFGPNAEFDGNSMEAFHSQIRMDGCFGSGSSKFGCYAHSNSLVTLFPIRRQGVGNGATDNFAVANSGLGQVVTMTIAAAAFATSDVGKTVTIAGSTSAGNNGTFYIIARPSATSIQYYNANAVAELLLVGTSYKVAATVVTGSAGNFTTNGFGTGDSLTFTGGPNTVVLVDSGASFSQNDVGKNITIAGSGAGNNGTFAITVVNSPTSVTYVNAGGATESPFPGTWLLDASTWASMHAGSKITNEVEMTLAKEWLGTYFNF